MSGMTGLYLITREDKMIKRGYQLRYFVCLISIIGKVRIAVLVSTQLSENLCHHHRKIKVSHSILFYTENYQTYCILCTATQFWRQLLYFRTIRHHQQTMSFLSYKVDNSGLNRSNPKWG